MAYNHFYEVQGSWLVKSEKPLTDEEVRELCLGDMVYGPFNDNWICVDALAVHQIDAVEPNKEDLV